MDFVYVAGHKNPDMDCTCAAHCYAALKRRLDPNTEYRPIRNGPLSAQIRDVFELAGASLPPHHDTIAPSVGYVARRSPVRLGPNQPVLDAFQTVEDQTISAIPVFDDEQFVGVIGVNEITGYILAHNRGDRPVYSFLVDNFAHVLPGTILQSGQSATFDAPIATGSMPRDRAIELLGTMDVKPVLVVGNRPEIIAFAVDRTFPAIILTGVADPGEIEVDLSAYAGAVYLSSTDTAETIRLLRLSSPLRTIMDRDVPRLTVATSFDDAKKFLLNSKYRGLPVFDGDRYLGIVSRRSFIERPRPRLIMIDHNEISQAIPGAEEAEILEIVDHHRLAPPSTTTPIAVTTRAVGSSCTLVYEEFANRGLAIERETAILLLSGIISDTVNLQSPTTTEADRRAVHRLETITGISAPAHAERLFAQLNALENRKPGEIILSDFKEYKHDGYRFGIGQVEVTTLSDSRAYRPRLLSALESVSREKSLVWTMLLVTDVIKRNSLLLTSGFEAAETLLPYHKIDDRSYELPDVLSRKKQLLPEVMRALTEIQAR